MTEAGLHVMERNNRVLRARFRVARELEKLNKTAKEISNEVWWATEERVDYRTIQNAAAGIACSLDTYDALVGTYGWNFDREVMTPRVGADPIAALEREIANERAEIAARERELERLKAAGRARESVAGGQLRLVPEEERRVSP